MGRLRQMLRLAESRNEALLEKNAGLEKRAVAAEELWQEAFADNQALEARLCSAEEAAARAMELSTEAARAQAAALEGLELYEANSSAVFEESGEFEARFTDLMARYESLSTRHQADTFSLG